MRSFEIGLVLWPGQYGPDRVTPRWGDLRAMAGRAEELGIDTLWTLDELVWLWEDKPVEGYWEGLTLAGAVAASTSRAKVGTWVMSALHRNAGMAAKAAETLDEISGGRFVFGLGAGHEWPGQAHAFGLPEKQLFDRFEEALQVIVPLLREGRADFEGRYHVARNLPQVPRGPRPGRIPLVIGGIGPRGQRLAVRHADTWSSYAEHRSHVDEFAPRIETLHRICDELGRDPKSIGRSAGVSIEPLARPGEATEGVIAGSPQEIADALHSFIDAGYTQVEVVLTPVTLEAVDAFAPVLEILDAR